MSSTPVQAPQQDLGSRKKQNKTKFGIECLPSISEALDSTLSTGQEKRVYHRRLEVCLSCACQCALGPGFLLLHSKTTINNVYIVKTRIIAYAHYPSPQQAEVGDQDFEASFVCTVRACLRGKHGGWARFSWYSALTPIENLSSMGVTRV